MTFGRGGFGFNVAPPSFQEEWYRCKPWIEAALEYGHGTHTIDDIENEIKVNRMLLIPGEHSCLLLEIINHPQKRDLNIFAAGGDLSDLKIFAPHIEGAARSLKCQRITAHGRRGWARVFRNLGCEEISVILAKDL